MVADTRVVFRNASVLDAERGELVPEQSVVVEGGRVRDVGGLSLRADGGRVIDVRGQTLMPGLIDAHVHVTAASADLAGMADWAPSYVTARAVAILRGMVLRGFTTVRDAGGADWGLAAAVQEGHLVGPRLLFGGKALSQTGGHGDMRPAGRALLDASCPIIGTVCDGVDEVRRTARHELRRGAHHLKIMLSGGVASPTDRVDSTQFGRDEIRAAVEEAEAANRYVMGHAYTSRAINRGLECGVRSIEHGNLMDDSSPPLFLRHDAFYVPTLATYAAMARDGRAYGLPEVSHGKLHDVLDAGLRALELAERSGLAIVYGTDLLGPMHREQCSEFRLRAQVQAPAAIVRAATTTAARLLRLDGEIGVVQPGALADLLVVDGNPLADAGVLADPAVHLKLVMKAGQVIVDRVSDG